MIHITQWLKIPLKCSNDKNLAAFGISQDWPTLWSVAITKTNCTHCTKLHALNMIHHKRLKKRLTLTLLVLHFLKQKLKVKKWNFELLCTLKSINQVLVMLLYNLYFSLCFHISNNDMRISWEGWKIGILLHTRSHL